MIAGLVQKHQFGTFCKNQPEQFERDLNIPALQGIGIPMCKYTYHVLERMVNEGEGRLDLVKMHTHSPPWSSPISSSNLLNTKQFLKKNLHAPGCSAQVLLCGLLAAL